jgi:hypothetical protein
MSCIALTQWTLKGTMAVAAVSEEESNRVRCQEQIVKSLYRPCMELENQITPLYVNSIN